MKMSRIHPSFVKEVSIDVSPIPPLRLSSELVYFSPHHTIHTKCRFFCDEYRKRIIGVIIILFSLLIVVLASSSPVKETNNPCVLYDSEEYASRISFTCFQYLWDRTCRSRLPDGFDGGWWLRSPDGGRMIPCSVSYTETTCGAGSYKTLTTYLSRCNPYYDGK